MLLTKKVVDFARHNINALMSSEEFASKKIEVIQMPIIDVCNSRCNMCNIWKNKVDKRINYKEYEKILSDPLFEHVKYIGLNGGEPTLHPNLVDIVRIANKKLKKLKSVNIITNAILHERAYMFFSQINDHLKKNNIAFNIGISLDGDEEHHDANRGIKGNYQFALTLLKKLQTSDIQTWVGCTLTKKNIYCGDDIILFAEEHNLPHFEVRMGVNIKRLYNQGFFESQKLSSDELFHAAQFFQKLYNKFPSNYFYKSLFKQLAYGEKRTAGCSWRHSGVTLDAEGNLSFCSVASQIVGNCTQKNASEIYKKNISKRNVIIKNKCQNCMHDLNGPLPIKIKLKERISHIRNVLRIKKTNNAIKNFEPQQSKISYPKPKLSTARNIIITGWYGTETQGDKAILGELFNFLNKKCPNLKKIYITHFPEMSYVVEKTIEELRETKICDTSKYSGSIPIIDFHASSTFRSSDFIIVGGGPIERVSELYYIEQAFRKARSQGKGSILFGCGIDPILGELQPVVKSILLNASHAFFRDEDSLKYARKITNNLIDATYACDPAINFVKTWRKTHQLAPSKYMYDICTLVRENTNEYVTNKTSDQIINQNANSIKKISHFLESHTGKAALLSMNNLWIGGDDRIYNRKILSRMGKKEKVGFFEHKYMGLQELLTKIAQSRTSLVTRYHGHLFSMALHIPFISIDYTGKGNKVENFLKRTKLEHVSVAWKNFTADQFIIDQNPLYKKSIFIKQNEPAIKKQLAKITDNLTQKLLDVYEQIH